MFFPIRINYYVSFFKKNFPQLHQPYKLWRTIMNSSLLHSSSTIYPRVSINCFLIIIEKKCLKSKCCLAYQVSVLPDSILETP